MVWPSPGAVGVLERSTSRLLDGKGFGPPPRQAPATSAAALTFVLVLFVSGGVQGDRSPAQAGARRRAAGVDRLAGRAREHRARDRHHLARALGGAVPAGIGLQLGPSAVAYYLVRSPARPGHVFLVFAGVLFACDLAALALLPGAAVATRLGLRTLGSRRSRAARFIP